MTVEQELGNLAAAAVYGANAVSSVAKQGARLTRRALQGKPRSYDSKTRQVTYTRFTSPSATSLTAGLLSTNLDFTLNQVQTSDLVVMYDTYRINYVRLHFCATVHPGNGGITHNTQVVSYVACEPSAQLTTPTPVQVAAFANAKVALVGERTFSYTFKPKATNQLAAGAYGVQTGWLYCDAAGVAVPHHRLLWALVSSDASSVEEFTYWFEVNFTVRGAY